MQIAILNPVQNQCSILPVFILLMQTNLYMSSKTFLAACAFLCMFSGCVTRSYYISPLYGAGSTYHTMPTLVDTTKSALFANASIITGASNEDLRDHSFSVQGSIYNTQHFGMFRSWYGAGITGGNYYVTGYDSTIINPEFDTATINKLAGRKFFGSANAGGGITFFVPLGRAGEWRVVSVTATVQDEFGKYLQFRQMLYKNGVQVNGVVPQRILTTLGISSEFCFAIRNGTINLKGGFNYLLGKYYKDSDFGRDGTTYAKRYVYVSNTLALSVNRFTGFLQSNLGQRMSNLEVGFNYRLSSFKIK